MNRIIDSPLAIFFIALFALWGAAFIGDRLRRGVRPVKQDERDDLDTVLAATLTLLALIIGFSFSMAVNRYDQRKTCEAAEANAIGTEYIRADLLPANDAAAVRSLLRKYLDQRIAFYRGGGHQTDGADLEQLQIALWAPVAHAAALQPTPVVTLAVSGMNDVLNSQSYTQAAWSNRIPVAAWVLMGLIAIFANLLLGYRERSRGFIALLILPVVSSIAFFLVADIDSPYGGAIGVSPTNLVTTSQFMK